MTHIHTYIHAWVCSYISAHGKAECHQWRQQQEVNSGSHMIGNGAGSNQVLLDHNFPTLKYDDTIVHLLMERHTATERQ